MMTPAHVDTAPSMRGNLARALFWLSAVLLAIEVGGGFFEHLVLDRAWPERIELIQPARGGAHRAPFWIFVHSALSVALLLALWAAWPWRTLRRRIAWALGLHVALRVWSFAYFIPAALRFEAATTAMEDEVRTWVVLSPLRTALTFAALAILLRPRDVPLR